VRSLRRLLVILLAATALLGQAAPEPHPGFLRLLRGEIARFRKAYGDPGIALTLLDGAGSQWDGTFGLADRATGRRVDAGTVFELGSISKLFTCAAVLQLREQGLVDLDRPLRDYLPEFDVPSPFAKGAEAITVRMLMTHHAGLVMDDDPWETTVPERYFYRAVLPHLKERPLLFPPGERMHYSSFGINLLGLLVERRSGMDFARYLRERLLAPLDMPSASFDYRDHPEERLAVPYGYPLVWDAIPKDELRPAGSLRAPVAEAAHFAAMILGNGEYKGRRVLAPESVREMIRIQNGDNPLDQGARVALGFMAEPAFLKGAAPDEVTVLFHYGAGRTRSLLGVVPAWGQGFVLSCNDYAVTDASYNLFSKAWSWYLRTLFDEAGQPYQHHRPVPDLQENPAPATQGGAYASTRGLRVLTPAGPTLVDQRGVSYVPLADGRFAAQPWAFPRVLYRFEGDRVLATVDEYPVDAWERLGPPESAGTDWAGTWERVGAGRGPERIELREEGGRVLVRPVSGLADDPAALFPLRLLEPRQAEVVNGARSGFSGCRFRLEEGSRLVLSDRLGSAAYRRLP
jgi:CubicO group peptidase (beta-lactamase class C family)